MDNALTQMGRDKRRLQEMSEDLEPGPRFNWGQGIAAADDSPDDASARIASPTNALTRPVAEQTHQQARALQSSLLNFDPYEVALSMATGPRARVPGALVRRPAGEPMPHDWKATVEEPGFRRLMGQEYAKAKAGSDYSGMYDILSARLYRDKQMPQAMREAMELELEGIKHALGPEWMAKYGPK